MVTTILGPDFLKLFRFCEKSFSLKTVLNIAMQMISRLETLHKKNFIHRDLKPENIASGFNKKTGTFHLIDFGLAKRYICPRTGKHIQFKKGKGVIGTPKYMSVR
jgi:serine/threonine protein kinase